MQAYAGKFCIFHIFILFRDFSPPHLSLTRICPFTWFYNKDTKLSGRKGEEADYLTFSLLIEYYKNYYS